MAGPVSETVPARRRYRSCWTTPTADSPRAGLGLRTTRACCQRGRSECRRVDRAFHWPCHRLVAVVARVRRGVVAGRRHRRGPAREVGRPQAAEVSPRGDPAGIVTGGVLATWRCLVCSGRRGIFRDGVCIGARTAAGRSGWFLYLRRWHWPGWGRSGRCHVRSGVVHCRGPSRRSLPAVGAVVGGPAATLTVRLCVATATSSQSLLRIEDDYGSFVDIGANASGQARLRLWDGLSGAWIYSVSSSSITDGLTHTVSAVPSRSGGA